VIYVDTNILIDALRGYQPATEFIAQSSQTDVIACSQVCEVELLLGAPSRALRRPIDRLLRDLTVVTPTQDDFTQAVEHFRKFSLSHGVEFFDCLVAATALRLTVPVYTRNRKHLACIPGLKALEGYSTKGAS
jgi:predicted nucleic acid-binding protein